MGLGLAAAALRKLAKVPAAIAKDAATGINREIRKQARAGTDPNGKPHAPLKAPRRSGRSGPPLVDSGASYEGTGARAMAGAGISVTLGGHLPRHMLATSTRPARPAFPRGGFPPAWKAAIDKAAAKRAPR